MATPVNNSAWLEWMTNLMGGVSRQSIAAAFPPQRFYCLLEELPVHLIPQRSRQLLRTAVQEPLYFNPECVLMKAGQAPGDIPEALLQGLALQGTIAWVREPNGGWLPFWLDAKFEDFVSRLRPGEEISSSVHSSAKSALAAAGIFIGKCGDRKADAGREASEFQAKGYVPLGDLIHPFHVAALRRYYRTLLRTGVINLGDDQSNRRYVAHNEPVARFFHHQIARRFSAVAGVGLKPSYVYLASYLSGAELKKHTDREQCDYSLTFCLDFSPEPALATPWPIQLETAKGTVKVYQALGDGLAYRGTKLPHYRSRLGEGLTSTSIFFHYVAEDFVGPLD